MRPVTDTVPLAHDVSGAGPLLVLIHGITENRHAWDPVTDDLAADHRVLRVDLRGHGESPKGPSYGAAELAADVHALVDEVPLVVGHSLGGFVATAYAARFETRGVINVDQTLDLAPLQGQLQAAAPALRGDGFGDVIAALFESLRGEVPDAEWARLSALRRPERDVVLGVWSVLLDTTPAELAAEVEQLTAAVRTPYLALDGVDPGPGHLEWLQSRMPQARLEVWDGVGHYPQLVRPDDFVERVREFERGL